MSKVSFPLPCVVCKKQAKASMPVQGNHPRNGLSFEATGQYGSAFDPLGDSFSLVVTICDDCVEKAAMEGVLVQKEKPRVETPQPIYTPFQMYGEL